MPEGLENLKKSNELSRTETLLLNKIAEIDERTLWLKGTVFDLLKDVQLVLQKQQAMINRCNTRHPEVKQ